MDTPHSTKLLKLLPHDNKRLATLCGPFNENLYIMERHLGVEINSRGNEFQIIGTPKSIQQAYTLLENLYKETNLQTILTPHDIVLHIQANHPSRDSDQKESVPHTELVVHHVRIKPRTPNQHHYLQALLKHDINFAIGPSGTGKTFLAIVCAVAALEKDLVSRIVLTRPAVEAGEKLGYLPGDLIQKIDPYLRPLYDALFEILGVQKVAQLLEKGTIEVAPLAYMRGRTLNSSYVILDEAQNATKEQMKMFLTRIGFGSKVVITGDITQMDLPKNVESGLRHALTLLQNIKDIHFSFFKPNDIVRHPLIQQIIEAYENANA